MKMMLDLHDGGNYFIINSAYTTEEVDVLNPAKKLNKEIKDAELFESITNLLASGSYVKFLKNKELKSTKDLEINKLDILEKEKINASTKIRNILNNHISNIDIFNFYQFTIANNILNDAGFTITDENVGDQTTAIKNKGDKTLTNALSTLIDSKANIEKYREVYSDSITALQSIEDAIDINSIDTTLNTFTTAHS